MLDLITVWSRIPLIIPASVPAKSCTISQRKEVESIIPLGNSELLNPPNCRLNSVEGKAIVVLATITSAPPDKSIRVK